MLGRRETEGGLTVVVAAEPHERDEAFRLAHSVYARKGLVSHDSFGRIVLRQDAHEDTLTLLAHAGRDAVGTLSVVVDSEQGLPADEVFGDELDELRVRGLRVGEYTRLAIDERHRGTSEVLLHLFYLSIVWGHYICGSDVLVAELHPKHARYYQRVLSFEPIGSPRPCPRVADAPAALVQLRTETVLAEMEAAQAELLESCPPSAAKLYRKFAAIAPENVVAAFLQEHHLPMSLREQARHGLLELLEAHG
jgi:hypothetical protein